MENSKKGFMGNLDNLYLKIKALELENEILKRKIAILEIKDENRKLEINNLKLSIDAEKLIAETKEDLSVAKEIFLSLTDEHDDLEEDIPENATDNEFVDAVMFF